MATLGPISPKGTSSPLKGSLELPSKALYPQMGLEKLWAQVLEHPMAGHLPEECKKPPCSISDSQFGSRRVSVGPVYCRGLYRIQGGMAPYAF